MFQGRHNAETISSWSLPSTSYLESNMAQNHCSISAVSESYETYQDPSPFSIGSMDVSSDLFDVNNLLYEWGIPEDFNSLLDADTTQAEQRIAEHLSLADNNMGEISHQCLNEKSEDSEVLLCERRSDQDEFLSVQHGSEYRENGQQSCDNVGEFSLKAKALHFENWINFQVQLGLVAVKLISIPLRDILERKEKRIDGISCILFVVHPPIFRILC